MIASTTNFLIPDRDCAGRLLSKKLTAFKREDSVVVGIPHGGVCVASAIADALQLPLEVMPCRKIKDPADGTKNIGSVSINEIFIHDCAHDIPHDYIYHQIILLRSSIQHEHDYYYGEDAPQIHLFNKNVILVDDVLKSSDTIMACLRGIKKQGAQHVTVSIPVVSAQAVDVIREEAEEVAFLKMEPEVYSGKDHFADFPKIDKHQVRNLLNQSRRLMRHSYS